MWLIRIFLVGSCIWTESWQWFADHCSITGRDSCLFTKSAKQNTAPRSYCSVGMQCFLGPYRWGDRICRGTRGLSTGRAELQSCLHKVSSDYVCVCVCVCVCCYWDGSRINNRVKQSTSFRRDEDAYQISTYGWQEHDDLRGWDGPLMNISQLHPVTSADLFWFRPKSQKFSTCFGVRTHARSLHKRIPWSPSCFTGPDAHSLITT